MSESGGQVEGAEVLRVMTALRWAMFLGAAGLVAVALALAIFVINSYDARDQICTTVKHAFDQQTGVFFTVVDSASAEVKAQYVALMDEALSDCGG